MFHDPMSTTFGKLILDTFDPADNHCRYSSNPSTSPLGRWNKVQLRIK